ncbi:hypothetical protein [Noviherbaspirillum sp.]|uniref:hypothetical protein n=1 Tax=Noviherbaspirillum sp. TaxID=1926288 RepID=UPI002D5E7AE9|nr:hypothetical protein [Noviherbaspirillum sp.]HZW21450.1 hypothetical protein [Noviherbaspirillum sp.]
MNLKVVDEATNWARTVVARNGGEIPDWTAYRNFLRERTGVTYGASVPVPMEYHYVYLRLKGNSHQDALERLGFQAAADSPAAESKPWWRFW